MSITLEHVSYVYSPQTPYEYKALDDVSLDIQEGVITAVIGQTGSGKSTLVQHLNALLLPTEGTIQILGRTITAGVRPKHLKSLRKDVGLVFQFPEYQLFEETVIKDVAFGPKNFGASEEDALAAARKALTLVGLNQTVFEKSPLELSGGQKRRAAIAGILAMDPSVLVLDEPTAGLDPQGTVQMMELFRSLNRKSGKTILIVTHDMEQVYRYCDRVIVVENGKIRTHTDVVDFFSDSQRCIDMNILPPSVIRMKDLLIANGFDIPSDVHDIEGLAKAVAKQVKANG